MEMELHQILIRLSIAEIYMHLFRQMMTAGR